MRLRGGGTPWGAIVVAENASLAKTKADKLIPVSYTHLTLPTSDLV